MKMMLSEIAHCVQGTLIGNDLAIETVSIDTRSIQAGQLYIAIKGENFDGNAFVEQAARSGAVAALVHTDVQTNLPHIVVDDTRLALGGLAAAWRRACENLSVIGVTGSNGKTTTKEMLAAILGVHDAVLYTQGNLNNDIGMPLTLLCLNEQHRYAVIEMGANHPKEIEYTSTITQADVVLITNVGAAHIEGFGSIDGVSQAKGEIIATLKADGVAVLNRDDAYFDDWQTLAGARKTLSFGLHPESNVTAQHIQTGIVENAFVTTFELLSPQGKIDIHLQLAGKHNVVNALAAATACLALGISLAQIKQGLERVKAVTGRLQLLRSRLGNAVIDDTYNANADSLKAGLDVLANCAGERWLILGAFGELGADSLQIHTDMGALIKSYGVSRIFAVGENTKHTVAAFGAGALFFDNQQQLITELIQALSPTPTLPQRERENKEKPTLVIKGSRSQRMENVAAALINDFRTA